ncbi:MAG: acyl-CoA dehydrogenase [Candidatus Marinimicrobia bacterium]|nr:acyl-CoA dehydrogenase [Candidatus Neomarinimicrobiota bacterium]
MDFNYSEEQLLIKQTAHDFAEEHLAPGVMERDEKAEFPTEQIKMMAELGFLGMMVPEKWNGAGIDTISYVIAIEEIACVDASAAVVMSVNNSLVCQVFLNWCTDQQKQKYLPRLAAGELLGAYSLSEPQSGSDASNMRTFAEKDGNYYILNGTKNWVTNGISSDLVLVYAMTTKGIGYKGITAFIVEKSRVGFSVGKKEDKLGIRGSDTCEIYFDNCRLPAENVIGEVGQGFKIALNTLDGGRIGIASQALGIGRAALEKSLAYSKERVQFGKPIAEFGSTHDKFSNMACNIDAARLLIYRAAALKDARKRFTKEAAMAKYFASKIAMEATTQCVQIFGGYGYMCEYGVERLMRDAKITQIYEGTSEIQQLVIARELLKE